MSTPVPEKSLLAPPPPAGPGASSPLSSSPPAPRPDPLPVEAPTPAPPPPVKEPPPFEPTPTPPHLDTPAGPPVGREALSAAFLAAGIGFPIDRARFLNLAKGHLVEYAPGEKVPLDELFWQCQASAFYSEDQAQVFAQSIMLRAPDRYHGNRPAPTFSTHHRRSP